MRVVVDAFGGDNAPLEIIKGASLASNEYSAEITLTGKEETIKKIIAENDLKFYGELKIVDTDDVISMHDEPTSLVKAHSESSMALAFKELAENRADAFVSAGSTGAIVVGGTLIIKRIKGVKRPALAGIIPAPKGHYMLMDMGANAECRPEMLCQFGIMASAYLEGVEGKKNPEIGLLNIGTEDTKGGELQKEAYKLMTDAPINFVGNIESREMPKGVCDAVITDGFTGNIALKLIEGTSSTLFSLIKEVFYKSLPNKLAALVVKKDLSLVKRLMDSTEVGGAPLLGVRKTVIKAHGSSNAKAVKNAVGQAIKFTETGVVEKITASLSEIKEAKEQ
ncbi:MAG: phosphate acyltransferase PlsX [Acutalibacteraceae bacterium]|nr:phosphate acyltransferase PlsX [Acutalibacteraceae bacterium]